MNYESNKNMNLFFFAMLENNKNNFDKIRQHTY